MTIDELLRSLREAGATLSVTGGEIRLSAPDEITDRELLGCVEAYKEEIIQLVQTSVAGSRCTLDNVVSRISPQSNLSALDSAEQTFRLASSQRRFWDGEQQTPWLSKPFIYYIKGKLEVSAFAEVLDGVATKQRLLSTTVKLIDDVPFNCLNVVKTPVLEIIRQEQTSPRIRSSVLFKRSLKDNVFQEFDLSRGPLFRPKLYELAPNNYILVLDFHHIVIDGWSLKILCESIGGMYSAYTKNGSLDCTPLKKTFVDFVRWEENWRSTVEFQRRLLFWLRELDDAPSEQLVVKHKGKHGSGRVETIFVAPRLLHGLQLTSSSFHMSLPIVCLGAYTITIGLMYEFDDVVIGCPVANRPSREWHDVIGCFADYQPSRTRFTTISTVRDVITHVGTQSKHASLHFGIPALNMLKPFLTDMEFSNVFRFTFNYLYFGIPGLTLPECATNWVEYRFIEATRELSLFLYPSSGGLQVNLNYDSAEVSSSFASAFLRYFERTLRVIATNPEIKVDRLEHVLNRQKTAA